MRFVLFACLVTACGSSKTPTRQPDGTGGGGGSAVAVVPDVHFKEMDHDQKMEFMRKKVVPAMKPLFQKHDSDMFKDFGCKTCHGKDEVSKGTYKMPNPDLPKLNFADMSKFNKDDLEFMEKEVKPVMAKLFGRPEYSEEHKDGFGCLACHTQAP